MLLYSNVLRLVGQAELDISLQIADYEQCLDESVILPLIQMVEVSNLSLSFCYCYQTGSILRHACLFKSSIGLMGMCMPYLSLSTMFFVAPLSLSLCNGYTCMYHGSFLHYIFWNY